MMKVALVGRDLPKILDYVKNFGFEIDSDNPDIVISNGGDGALLGAERLYPEIPKLGLRDSKTSLKHDQSDIEYILGSIINDDYVINEYIKLKVVFGEQEIHALNDIMLRNEIPTSGIRFYVEINGSDYTGEVIGDGLIVATPIGSSAYYKSITHSIFQVGIGVAFNNSTEPITHLVVDDNSIVKVNITRGPALVAGDNNNNYFHLDEYDEVIITKSEQKAKIISCIKRNEPSAFTRLV